LVNIKPLILEYGTSLYAMICSLFFCWVVFFNNLLSLLQDHFVLIVSEFMFIPWDYAQKQAATREALRDGNSCTPSITIVAAENFESHMVEYIKGQVLMRIFVSER